MIKTNAREFFAPLMILFLLAVLSTPAAAQKQPSDAELVKQTQNPVADLISVPLQNNFNFDTGSKNRMVWVGNIQPVIPIKLGDDWNLITRTIVPNNQPTLFVSGNEQRHRAWRHQPEVFFLTGETRRTDLGSWSDVYVGDGDRQVARRGQMEHGPGGGGADDARTLGVSGRWPITSGRWAAGATAMLMRC